MRESSVRSAWGSGRPAINGWISSPSTLSAAMLATLEWDSLTLDLQHGSLDYQDAVGIFTAMSAARPDAFVRLPWNDPALIMKLLDAGCYGLICPMISTASDAAAFVSACRYPPAGFRSFGPSRAILYAGRDYFEHANSTIVTVAIIETAEGLGNLDAIAAVPGLDALYAGAVDLGISLGQFGPGKPPNLDNSDPNQAANTAKIVEAAHRHGLKACVHVLSDADVKRALAFGPDMLTISSDLGLMMSGAANAVKAIRDQLPQAATAVSGTR
jgi:4-hydroxy-2-oxoheptanedioate aldolase